MRPGPLAVAVLALLVGACGDESSRPDGSMLLDAADLDAPLEVGTHRDELDLDRLGRCEPDEADACGCIDGFRRCDLCDARCPLGWGHENVEAQVCRALDIEAPDAWQDTCGFHIDDEGFEGRVSISYCETGKVCAVGADDDGVGVNPFGGKCFPVSFCLAAQTADPPAPHVRCVYSDGSEVVDGPPPMAECPEGDPRQPFCGGPCGESTRCPTPAARERDGFFDTTWPFEPGPCVGLSESRGMGVCGMQFGRYQRGAGSDDIDYCEAWYGEPCLILVTHPQSFEHGHALIASVCHEYVALFPESAECRNALWEVVPAP